ncbi:MAG: hypothetical protein KDB88_11155, partial [Flavobacteriales bacterium]|nr:hypothetical protein [Flavobacteriales bacterium]
MRVLSLLSVLTLIACQSGRPDRPLNKWGEPTQERVLLAQQSRNSDSLLALLLSEDRSISMAAALALGSVQDSSTIPWLEAQLENLHQGV